MTYDWYTRKAEDGRFIGRVRMTVGDKSVVLHSAKFVTRSRAESWVKRLVSYYEGGGQPKPGMRLG